jgi:protein-L-isoaspartate(D-aspartate) O-methyltransferase
VTVERYRTLADAARARRAPLGCRHVEVVAGDGYDVPETLGSFDRIIVTAAMEAVPDALMERLEPEGVMIVPIGPPEGVQQLVRLRKGADGVEQDDLIPVRFVPALKGLAKEL